MEENFAALPHSMLFRGIDSRDLTSMLRCLAAIEKPYGKGEVVFAAGTRLKMVGMVLTGAVQVEKEDFWGNRSILTKVLPGELFGEAYACVPDAEMAVTVIATERTHVLFLQIHKILTVCTAACTFHTQLLHNFLDVLARRNLMLTRKLEHLSKRTTREKLLSYLSAESSACGRETFTIPFNRQELADYLGIDRSAMTSVLTSLRREGVLDFDRNTFRLARSEQDGGD